LGFAVAAAAAVWTKQLAVFAGAVPFLLLVLERNWRALRRTSLWLSAGVFAALVFALTLPSSQLQWAGIGDATAVPELREIVLHNLGYYAAALAREVGVVPAVLLMIALVVSVAAGRNRIYVAWTLASGCLLLILGHYDTRYLFYTLPPLVVIGLDRLAAAARRVLPRAEWVPGTALVAAFAALNVAAEVPHQRGPAEAAEYVMAGGPARIVYCGRGNGAFTFAVRSHDPRFGAAVIRGDKLAPATFSPAAFESFAHRYGIRYVVLERTALERPWNTLFDAPSRSMVLERELPLYRSEPPATGVVRVYRFTNPSPHPEDSMTIPMNRIGGELEVTFEE
jgi:hypothetical protein